MFPFPSLVNGTDATAPCGIVPCALGGSVCGWKKLRDSVCECWGKKKKGRKKSPRIILEDRKTPTEGGCHKQIIHRYTVHMSQTCHCERASFSSPSWCSSFVLCLFFIHSYLALCLCMHRAFINITKGADYSKTIWGQAVWTTINMGLVCGWTLSFIIKYPVSISLDNSAFDREDKNNNVSIILMMLKATMELLFYLKDSKGLFWTHSLSIKNSFIWALTAKQIHFKDTDCLFVPVKG